MWADYFGLWTLYHTTSTPSPLCNIPRHITHCHKHNLHPYTCPLYTGSCSSDLILGKRAHPAGHNTAYLASPQGSKTKRPGPWVRKKITSWTFTFPFPLFIVISYTEATSQKEQSHLLPELNGGALSFLPLHIILLSWWLLCKHILPSFANWGIFHILRLRLMFHLPQRDTGWDFIL